ncbi:MAG: hypothetical protein SFW67_32670 [Myxococcaceae bacterium]|nr:hypothetical protein [Myxococcaceae bacterium]
MTRRAVPGLALLLGFSACTAVNYTALPTQQQQGQIFITAQGLSEPYESVGIVQITRRGVLVFGFADPAGTDLATAVNEVEGQIRRAGADGLINTRVQQTNYTTLARIFGLIFFFAPLPAEVTITGELVRVRRGAAPVAPGMPAPVPVPAGGTPL